jgi:hypothetical protein
MNCDICREEDASHVSIFDDDGAVASAACRSCFDALDGGSGCCVCEGPTSGEYRVDRDGPNGRSGGPLCAACRRLWAFDNTPALATRIVRLGIDRFTEEGDE